MNRFLPLWALLAVLTQATLAQEPGLLPPPVPISPQDGVRLQSDSRTKGMVFEWSPVLGASGYAIEIDCYQCCQAGRWCSDVGKSTFVQALRDTRFPFTFYGDQPGSWRLWTITPAATQSCFPEVAPEENWRLGKPSPWFVFTFAPSLTPLPEPPGNTAQPIPFMPALRSSLVSLPCVNGKRLDARGASLTGLEQKLPTPPVFDPANGEACSWPKRDSGPGVTSPKALQAPDPQYPEAAREQRVNGDVKLAVDVGEDGRPRRVCILDTPRADFATQAVATVRTWKFEPATRNGVPIPFGLTVEVTFRIAP